MKTSMIIRVCAFLTIGAGVIFAAKAEGTWSNEGYDQKNKCYVLSNSVSATVLTLNETGDLNLRTAGTIKELDLRSAALPSNLPEIKKIGSFVNARSTLEKVYLPESAKIISAGAFKEADRKSVV